MRPAIGALFLAVVLFAGNVLAQAPNAAAPPQVGVQPAPDLSAFIGKPITRAEIVLDDETWEDVAIPPIRGVRAGEPFAPHIARRLLDEALGSGLFARGRVVVVLDGSGVRIVAHVVPRKVIETLRMDLHGARVERDEILHESDMSEGGELIGLEMPDQKRRIDALFVRHGYPSPLTTITTRSTDKPERVIVLVDVAPGVERKIGRRIFYVFGADERELSALDETYAIKEGARADENLLESADVALAARLRSSGHHRASVSHDLVLASGILTLRVRVDAGPRFVARFEGNDHYDGDTLTGALGLEEETDRTPGHLVQKIKSFYVKHGFLDAEVTAETRGGPDARTGEQPPLVFIVLHVVEHDRVAVLSRAYPCLKEDEVKRLTGGGPASASEIGNEIDSYLEEELPGADFFRDPSPRGVDVTFGGSAGGVPPGPSPEPIDLDPDATFEMDTYERAVLHVQELYRNEGYLHAQVGPLQVIRRRCDRRSPAGSCKALPLPHPPPDVCTYDATNLPLPIPANDPELTCVPDPAHGIECEPLLSLRIPIKLGPRTTLYDVAFTGGRSITEQKLAQAAGLALGEPANMLKVEEARRHILDAYKEEGYAYADVKYTLESSLDHTRARARFDIVEGDLVIVSQIVVRGNDDTNESVLMRRIVLRPGQPYRASEVRKTQERLATLNVFSSISVALEDPYVPQEKKTVVITVIERPKQYLEVRPGLSTGEGFRFAFEYGHRNLFGDAVGFSLRIQLSYLPDFLILDDQVRANFRKLQDPGERIATRSTASFALPEIGLGPLVRSSLDAVFVRDLQRDFALTKAAGIVNLYYRPMRELQFSISPDVERNIVNVFQFDNIGQYIQQIQASQGSVNADLSRLLRVPDGDSYALAQKFVVTWDRRDNSFNAHKGTYLASGVEHVDWYALSLHCVQDPSGQLCSSPKGHTLRFTETFAAYIPVTKTITLAGELRVGANVQMTPNSTTYPDRLFFLGGIESMRGWLQDTFVPQEYADQIARDFHLPDKDKNNPKFGVNDVVLRGGNLMVNPRLEMRIPVRPPLETVLFTDAGNLWLDPAYLLDNPKRFNLRFSVGTGIRFQTPVGPLALDYGVNMSRLIAGPNDPRRSYEDFGAFHFAIGLF